MAAKTVNNTVRTPEDLDARINAYAEAKNISKNRAILDLIEQGLNAANQPVVSVVPDLSLVLGQLVTMQETLASHEARLTAMECRRQDEVAPKWVEVPRDWGAEDMGYLTKTEREAIGLRYDSCKPTSHLKGYTTPEHLQAILEGKAEIPYIEMTDEYDNPNRWAYHAPSQLWYIHSFQPEVKVQSPTKHKLPAWLLQDTPSDDPYAKKYSKKEKQWFGIEDDEDEDQLSQADDDDDAEE